MIVIIMAINLHSCGAIVTAEVGFWEIRNSNVAAEATDGEAVLEPLAQ